MNDMQLLLAALAEVRDDVNFAHETRLVEEGIIDSLDLTQIIAALDEAFAIHIPAGEIEPDNFNSAEGMLALVQRYQQP
ncbi:MAG: phosphopantetheine-binding protein [Aristaeellaceae bacterium]